MKEITFRIFKTLLGELIIGTFNGRLCICDWRYRKMRNAIDDRIKKFTNAVLRKGSNGIIDNTIIQLEEYFNRERKNFDIPIYLAGSDFQKSVWKELMKIPYGEKISYKELAARLDNGKAIRAVAAANGANAISIIIPCHRVLGSDGEMTGYAGGERVKKKLLEIESGTSQMELF